MLADIQAFAEGMSISEHFLATQILLAFLELANFKHSILDSLFGAVILLWSSKTLAIANI